MVRTCWLSGSFHGGLFRALTSFTAVLPVNNSLVRRVGSAFSEALSWPVTHYRESDQKHNRVLS